MPSSHRLARELGLMHRRKQRACLLSAGLGGSLAAPVVDVAAFLDSAVALPAVGDDRRAWFDVVHHEPGAATRPMRRREARSGSGPSLWARGPRLRRRSAPSCPVPGRPAGPAPRRRCTSHRPPPSRPAGRAPDAPAPRAADAASSTPSGRSRSPASASGSAQKSHPSPWRTASRR